MLKSKAFSVLAVVAAATILSTVSASADNPVTHYENLYFANTPYTGSASCFHESIYLQAGTYTWSQLSTASEQLYLAAGTYTWSDCVQGVGAEYHQESTLATADHNPTYLEGGFQVNSSIGGGVTIRWGSNLYFNHS